MTKDAALQKFIFAIFHNELGFIRAFLQANDVNMRIDCFSENFLHCENLLRPEEWDATGKYYCIDHWFDTTPLMYAAAGHAYDSLQLLLEMGADAKAEDSIGMTALMYAILDGSERIALRLLDCGAPATSATHRADPALRPSSRMAGNEYTICGITPLHLAARADYAKLVNELLKKGADPQALDESNRTPLQIAIKSGSLQATYALQKHSPEIQVPRAPGAALELLDNYVVLGKNTEELRPLVQAALNDDYSRVYTGPNHSSDNYNMTLWKYGCMNKKTNALGYLVNNGFYSVAKEYPAGSNDRDENPLLLALRYELYNLALMIVNGGQYQPVQKDMAEAAVNLPLLSVCLKKGLNLKPWQDGKWHVNPLMKNMHPWDADDLSLTRLEFMLKNGAVFEYTYSNKCITLEAAACNNGKLLQMLARNGIDLNAGDQSGNTPLMKAASLDKLDVINCLLALGVKIDQQNNKGQTALLLAVNYYKTEAAKLLIEAGASLSLPDQTGTTVLALAEKRKLAELFTFIQKRSIKPFPAKSL